jgi:endonuclease-3 related protein
MQKTKNLLKVYKNLYIFFGPQHWWPAESPFEVMVGAVLTQNTSWNNVSKAVENLKSKRLLSLEKISAVSRQKLISAIRPAGFYRQKAAYLKNLSDFLIGRYDGNLGKMRKTDTSHLRQELLAVRGIGPETADSILLYALDKPVFVVDAYTRRVFSRHKLEPFGNGYSSWQNYFISNLPSDVKLYNEYHALIVRTAKNYCRTKPLCEGCPMEGI